MQRTRLNTFTDLAFSRLGSFFSNPWRRVSLMAIGLLLGFFMGQAIATTTGQRADWDIVTAGLVLLFTEAASRWAYGRRQQKRESGSSLGLDWLNIFKIGLAYSLYLEAFKLGS